MKFMKKLAINFFVFLVKVLPAGFLRKKIWNFVSWRIFEFSTSTHFDFKIQGTTRDLIQRNIFYFGIWEPNLTKFVRNRLLGLKGRVFLDIGANIGYFSLLASKVMPAGYVVSVEAYPSIYEKLIRNIFQNSIKNIRPVNCAVVDFARQVKMTYYGDGNEGRTFISSEGDVAVSGLPIVEILSPSEIPKVRLVKIDVEGAEYLVCKGLFCILDEFPHDCEFVIEINPSAHTENQISEIFDCFYSRGFSSYILPNNYDDDYYLNLSRRDVNFELKKSNQILKSQEDVVFSRIIN